MHISIALLSLFVAGMVGGIANALVADRGLVLPSVVMIANQKVWRPGFIGNMIVGGVAALIVGGLYGPLSAVEMGRDAGVMHVTFATIAGALVTGVGGARVISQEVDKRYDRAARKGLASTVDKLSR